MPRRSPNATFFTATVMMGVARVRVGGDLHTRFGKSQRCLATFAKILRLAPRLGEAGPRFLMILSSRSKLGREASGRSRGVGTAWPAPVHGSPRSFSARTSSPRERPRRARESASCQLRGPLFRERAPSLSTPTAPRSRPVGPTRAPDVSAVRSSETSKCRSGLRSSRILGSPVASCGLLLAFGLVGLAVVRRRGCCSGERSDRPQRGRAHAHPSVTWSHSKTPAPLGFASNGTGSSLSAR
jgi:hypothetical protein